MSIDATAVKSTENLYEVIDGEIVELPNMGTRQEMTAVQLCGKMWSYADTVENGRVAMETLFDFTEQVNKKRRPDVAFVNYDRWPRSKAIPEGDGWQVVPNLAVEIVSPSNAWDEVLEKVEEYFRVGVDRVWVVSTAKRKVHVFDSPTKVRILTENDELTDDEILPGFGLKLRELFSLEEEGEA